MSEQQPLRVSPPKKDDTGLADFSSVLQRDFEVLFDLAHSHLIKTSAPSARDGRPMDLAIVSDGTNVYLVVKTAQGWFRSPNFTAL